MGGQLWWAKCLSGNPPNFAFLLCAYSSVVAMWKINSLSLSLIWDPLPLISNNRSCTPQLRSGTFLLGSTALHSLYLSIFLYAWCFVKNVVLHGHLHLPTLGWCRQMLQASNRFKCHKSLWSAVGTPPLLSAIRARASALQALRL